MNLKPIFLSLIVLTWCGCSTYDAQQTRSEHTEDFRRDLDAQTAALLEQPLSLQDCLTIAMTNNYEARQADLRHELARLGKDIAFAEFLPKMTLAASATRNRFPNTVGGGLMAFERRSYSDAALNVDVPILTPSVWFLYAARRQQTEIAAVAAHYVRQVIVLETTRDYYTCLVQEEIINALTAQRDAAQETFRRIDSLAAEGMSTVWERELARARYEDRAAALSQAERGLVTARGALLLTLGLAPDASVTLAGAPDESALPDATLEERVLQALSSHPELAMADRNVVVRNHQVRQAFCDFLPNVMGFWTGTYADNTSMDRLHNWKLGLAGTWKLFDGFANVARYRSSKVERTSAELSRESLFLSIMLEVTRAHMGIQDATDAYHVATQNHHAYDLKSGDYREKMRAGLIPAKDSLEAEAERDTAQVILVQTRYQEAIARATLDLAMGTTLLPQTDLKKEE